MRIVVVCCSRLFSGVEEDCIFVVLDRGPGRLAFMLMGVRALGGCIGVATLGRGEEWLVLLLGGV